MGFLAKSDNTDLLTHSKKVSEAAQEILIHSIKNNKFQNEVDIVNNASLLHDIGKCTTSFQLYLKSGKETPKFKKNSFSHNQIGWAFLSKHLNISDNKKRNIILDSVYWHHGVKNYDRVTDSIIYDDIIHINNTDINNMKEYLISALGEEFYKEYDDNDNDILTPMYFSKNQDDTNIYETNVKKILVRSCVIGGDRFVSKFTNDELLLINIQNEISDSINRKNKTKITTTKYDNTPRYDTQINIVTQTKKTTIINAPAGFGKTLLGLMWGITKNDKKIIWVCPRNMVAESVYESVILELKNINIELSVELYLGGEIKKSNTSLTEQFESDIIITNIDNLLFTSTKNNMMNLSYIVNTANVIFDEYHELVTSGSIMSLFILMMNMRHKKLNSDTLLLSATPIPTLNHLWEGVQFDKTTFLPNENEHYDAAHNKKYSFNITDDVDLSDNNTITIFNSISESQKLYSNNTNSILLHSKFETDKRSKQFNLLYTLYGKSSKRNSKKTNIIGTHIIQASLDISANILNESVISPQATLQRIGRCDRWGDYNKQSKINIFKLNSKSELAAKKNLYDIDLSNKWFNNIIKYGGTNVTLNDIYKLYNDFNIINEQDIKKYVKMLYEASKNTIYGIYPIKYIGKKQTKLEKMKASSNLLRSNGNEIFIICENFKGGFSEAFNQQIYSSVDVDFHEDLNYAHRMGKDMVRMKDDRFDYSYINKRTKKTLDRFRREAKWSNRPYIRYDIMYHDKYGIIGKKLCESIDLI
jgi:CRISPR-associated helicase Cas3/CRISPR-associated endonuclease Cas3-HD